MSSLLTTFSTDSQALEQIASKQAEVDRLRTDAATLRAEKEQWQVSCLFLPNGTKLTGTEQ